MLSERNFGANPASAASGRGLPVRVRVRVLVLALALAGAVAAEDVRSQGPVELLKLNVGRSVVLVFKTTRPGRVTLAFGLTRGETAKAFESRTFKVQVR